MGEHEGSAPAMAGGDAVGRVCPGGRGECGEHVDAGAAAGPSFRAGEETLAGGGTREARGARARVRVELPSREGREGSGPLAIDVCPALLGVGLLAALAARLFGLKGVALGPSGDAALAKTFDAVLLGACWGALATCVLALVAVAFRARLACRGASEHRARVVLAIGAFVALAAFGAGLATGASSMWCGVAAGIGLGLLLVGWVALYARLDAWAIALHACVSAGFAGVLFLVGSIWDGLSPASLAYLGLLAALSCVLLAVARPVGARADSSDAETRDDSPGVGASRGEALRRVASFIGSQWIALVGMLMLALVHGLRWRSDVLGLTTPRPYESGGWEFALGPLIAVALVWLVLFRGKAASPQRAACQVLTPIAAALLLVIPVLNPLFGFWVDVDSTMPVLIALEVVLDVLNEAAVCLLAFSAFLCVAGAVRVTGASGVVAGAAMLASLAAGTLVGMVGYMAVGDNGSIVCFLVWTVYLLAVGLSFIGKTKDERDGARLSQESVENFIRRNARVISERYGLSQREEEVLRYLARGYSYTYTAQDFSLSENTVRTHAKHIYAKLGISKREELFRLFDATSAPDEVERG